MLNEVRNAILLLWLLICIPFMSHAQKIMVKSDHDQIIETLNKYIEGTSYNYPEMLKEGFMPGAQMFLDHPDMPLFVRTIEEYAKSVGKSKAGEFNGRVTNIISIDRFEGIASAKLEVTIPNLDKRFIDLLLLKKLEDGWKIISKTAASESRVNQDKNALLVLSSARFQGASDLSAGNSFSEVVIAYDEYQKAGYHVDIVSPKGGEVPLAYIDATDSIQLSYLHNADFMYAIQNTNAPEEINPDDYGIIQYTGGSAPIFDIPDNKEIQAIAMHIYENNNGVITAVCHGASGIINLKTNDGKYLVDGKKVNGYPDSHERKDLPHYELYPFIIETELKKRGGDFRFSDKGTPHVEVDGRLITGQNFLSSKEATIKSIQVRQKNTNR